MSANKFSQVKTNSGPRRELLGVPIIGVILAAFAWRVSQEPGVPTVLTDLIYGLSIFVFIGGVVLYFRAPSRFHIRDEESIIEAYHPRLVLAYVLMTASIPMLASSIYVFEYTTRPYVFVFMPLVVGLYLLISGILRYWKNTLTTYYITTERIVRATRFLSVDNAHLDIEKISSWNDGHAWYSGLLGIEQASFATPSGSIRLRDSPKDKNVVGMSRTLQNELSSRKMQQKARLDAEALRDALSDITPDSEKHASTGDPQVRDDGSNEDSDDSKLRETDNERSFGSEGTPEDSKQPNTEEDDVGDRSIPESSKEVKSDDFGSESNTDTEDVKEAVELLDRYVSGWFQDDCQNEYLQTFVNDQVELLEDLEVDVILPEIGSEADPHYHNTVATMSSSQPPKTILLVMKAGLRGNGVKQRDAQVVTSSGPE